MSARQRAERLVSRLTHLRLSEQAQTELAASIERELNAAIEDERRKR